MFERQESLFKMVCSFINPKAAKEIFEEAETSVSEGFTDDLMALNPSFDPEKYQDVIAMMEQ